MYPDEDFKAWRDKLQEARALHKKITAVENPKEREALLEQHKGLLDEARSLLHPNQEGDLTQELNNPESRK